MTASEPAWRIKSRPCPFFQHGRCLFADSCNFLHNVSVKRSSGPDRVESLHKQDFPMPRNMPPIVTVDSPRSIHSSHSPRLSGLLDALKDVIGEDAANDVPRPPSVHEPKLVDESEMASVPYTSDQERDRNMTANVLELLPTISSNDNPSIFQTLFLDKNKGDVEGYSEDEPTVRFSVQPQWPPSAQLEPNSPARPNSHFTPPSISSECHGRLIHRPAHLNIETPTNDFPENDTEPVIDSGYAESWHPHSPSPCTPPRARSSTLILLGSPFGSPSDKIQAQVSILGKLAWNTSFEQPLDDISDISLDCPKDCDSPRHAVAFRPTNDFPFPDAGKGVAKKSSGRRVSKRSSAVSPEDSLESDSEHGLQEMVIKDPASSVKNIPSGVPHSRVESVLVGSPAPPDQENSLETLDKISVTCDATNSTLFNSSNRDTSCRSSPLQQILTTSPHRSSSLNLQNRFSSTSTPRQNCYSARDSMSSTISSSSDVTRRMSFGWKPWVKSRSRASDPAISNKPRQPIPRRPSDFVITAGKASGRKHSDSVSSYCSSCGCAPRNLPVVVSPGHTTFTYMPNATNISPQSSTSVSMLSLSSSVSSAKSSTPDYLPSPPRTSEIPQQFFASLPMQDTTIPSPLSFTSLDLKNFSENTTNQPDSYDYVNSHDPSSRLSNFRFPKQNSESSLYRIDENGDSGTVDQHTRFCSMPTPTHSFASTSCRSSLAQPPPHAIAMPKPTLFFAIGSDNVSEVRKVLESGQARPNEVVGPQSALEFVLTNNQLTHKTEIIKLLLAYGANPSVLKKHRTRKGSTMLSPESKSSSKKAGTAIVGTIDPATSYFLEKAEAAETQRTTAMMQRSSFRAVTRVRYEIIGQDRVLEYLFKVLSIHKRHLSSTPIVVLLSGPSGHGKSMLARKFGSLLEVPTHIVNMTTLQTTQELWQSYSMDPDNRTSTTDTLADFLTRNEGKRCVVVLDEIEKTADEKVLWSLLMPWEHGRCVIKAGSRPIDVRNVVWIGTSNVAQDIVFQHQDIRRRPQEPISKEEYAELMELVRPKMSAHLGTSVVSRVTAILPFVPFTSEERKVICFEALYSLAGEEIHKLPSKVVDGMIDSALAKFSPQEGARSLYRAISDQLAINL